MKNVLLINAHQRYEGFAEGRLNATLAEVAKDFFEERGDSIKTTKVESGYQVMEEVEKHLWADIIIVQTPVYLMSVPYIYKKYLDEVLVAGMGKLWQSDGRDDANACRKYGTGGLMQGRKYMLSTTWNAPFEAFEDPLQFFEGKGVDDIFLWLHKSFRFLGVEPLPTFACFDVIRRTDVEKDRDRFKEHLLKVFR